MCNQGKLHLVNNCKKVFQRKTCNGHKKSKEVELSKEEPKRGKRNSSRKKAA